MPVYVRYVCMWTSCSRTLQSHQREQGTSMGPGNAWCHPCPQVANAGNIWVWKTLGFVYTREPQYLHTCHAHTHTQYMHTYSTHTIHASQGATHAHMWTSLKSGHGQWLGPVSLAAGLTLMTDLLISGQVSENQFVSRQKPFPGCLWRGLLKWANRIVGFFIFLYLFWMHAVLHSSVDTCTHFKRKHPPSLWVSLRQRERHSDFWKCLGPLDSLPLTLCAQGVTSSLPWSSTFSPSWVSVPHPNHWVVLRRKRLALRWQRATPYQLVVKV